MSENISEFVTRFNSFWNAADKLKRSQIIEILDLEDKNLRSETFRNLLECDTSYMTDEFLVSTMRIVAACGNKKSIVLGHLASGNAEYEKVSDSFYAIQRLNAKYKELEESEEIQKNEETKNKVVFEIKDLDSQIKTYFSNNNLVFSENFVSSDLRKNLTQIKADLEGKNEILNWQIATCKKAKSNKTYYATLKTVKEFKNSLVSNVEGKVALVAYKRDADKKRLFESKSKYQTRINESINTVFEEIQVEIKQRQNKLNDALEMISKRDVLANSLGIDTTVYSVEQVDKILVKYKDDIALVEELLHSYESQKKALISQIKEAANEVNIDYRYAMQNLLVLA
ncbi:MAG: hypothetical protein E7314_00120 [Clostridiales bacterium]|nr:hypothetical protein [Clostridiales bacterium]